MGIEIGGLLGLLLLVANVYAIIRTAGSHAGALAKAVWIVAILILPVFGLLAWLLFGPKG
ncbi:PLDc N-terminal domain-containing protein [Spiribacter halobius]|uniref:Cardiolipin synthase N-terminal domain-containing protein n=1 Tax=Sediminicurvatus halobius TaxID=2182432 RepID=A0A2U2N1H5_9GAMM|nr:PLDc N-terminal domain-containing protein [Spiribacter halobius]PWG62922.1 hypothetical protein DEM34_09980 [Spiribacter halobius]UEX77433.1 PLDc N-terminal domain-containing protein [Spiribacter halobius]